MWQIVGRITNEILGVKGFTGLQYTLRQQAWFKTHIRLLPTTVSLSSQV